MPLLRKEKNFIPFELTIYPSWPRLLVDFGWAEDQEEVTNFISSKMDERVTDKFDPLLDYFRFSFLNREMIYAHGIDSFSTTFSSGCRLDDFELDTMKLQRATLFRYPQLHFGYKNGDIYFEFLSASKIKSNSGDWWEPESNMIEFARLPNAITAYYYGIYLDQSLISKLDQKMTQDGWTFNNEHALDSWTFENKYLLIRIEEI